MMQTLTLKDKFSYKQTNSKLQVVVDSFCHPPWRKTLGFKTNPELTALNSSLRVGLDQEKTLKSRENNNLSLHYSVHKHSLVKFKEISNNQALTRHLNVTK